MMITDRNIIELMEDPDKFKNLKSKNIKDKLEMEPFSIAVITKNE
jgi:hypothetical protein